MRTKEHSCSDCYEQGCQNDTASDRSCLGRAIIERLKLLRPIYEKTAAYGHFGRKDFPWEQLEETLQAELKKLL